MEHNASEYEKKTRYSFYLGYVTFSRKILQQGNVSQQITNTKRT